MCGRFVRPFAAALSENQPDFRADSWNTGGKTNPRAQQIGSMLAGEAARPPDESAVGRRFDAFLHRQTVEVRRA
jgi:hypothetical protein